MKHFSIDLNTLLDVEMKIEDEPDKATNDIESMTSIDFSNVVLVLKYDGKSSKDE
jgi:hypothetical protein